MTLSTPTTAEPEAAPPGALFRNRLKVYPKAVDGPFRRLKWAAMVVLLAIYYLVPWIRWDRGPGMPDQAVLVDMAHGRLYFFFIEIWPQEVYYLTGLLVLGAVGLFLATAVAGRVWCGYACPQTVWTDLFLLVERKIEGDRSERIRLDRKPLTASKAARKLSKHLVWLLISVVTGGAWIFYFNDAPSLMADLRRFEASTGVLFFIGLFTATTCLLAGWAREQVCTYMCPWPRFQAAMMDEDSLIVTYQDWRGETRGPKRKNETWEARLARGGGDCIDCDQCVQVCPTGIDIRDGQQLECINCALCVDACSAMMTRSGRPTGLIAYDTLAGQAAKAAGHEPRYRPVRPRTVVYGALLVVVAALMAGGLLLRPHLEVSVLRDRAPLFVTLSDGSIRNGYTLKISNMTPVARAYDLTLAGPEGAAMTVVGREDDARLAASPDRVATYRVLVAAPRAALDGASTPIRFTLTDTQTRESATYDAALIGPAR